CVLYMRPRKVASRAFLPLDLKGHGFSRAGRISKKNLGFSPWCGFPNFDGHRQMRSEAKAWRWNTFTARLKPCFFKPFATLATPRVTSREGGCDRRPP